MNDDDSRKVIDDLRRDANTAQAAMMVLMEAQRRDVVILQQENTTLKSQILAKVEKLEFWPVKMLVYAMALGTLTTVLGALISKVIMK